MKFFTRHQPTDEQASLVKERFVEDLIQVDEDLPDTRNAMKAFLSQSGIERCEPIAMVAPVHIVELVRELEHPVVVFTATRRGVLISEDSNVKLVSLPAYIQADDDAYWRLEIGLITSPAFVSLSAEDWYRLRTSK